MTLGAVLDANVLVPVVLAEAVRWVLVGTKVGPLVHLDRGSAR